MASNEDKLGLLKTGLSDLLESGLFSDLQILCRDGTVYKVHKAILCSQSLFFKNALDPASNFVEAQSNTVKLESEHPAAVKALVQYFYHLEYTDIEAETGELLHFHTRTYAIGEKYRVQGLKGLAEARFANFYTDAITFEEMDIANVIKAIYDTTIPSDRGLRGLIIKLTMGDFKILLKLEGFAATMDTVGQYGRDMASALLEGQSTNLPRYGCIKCGAAIHFAIPAQQNQIFCPSCKGVSRVDAWKSTAKKSPSALSKFNTACCKRIIMMELCWFGPDSAITHCILCGTGHSRSIWEKARVKDEEKTGSKN